jgi:hypothetical protein
MTKQTINIGTSPNKGNGDPLRTAFDKTNKNFTELYDAVEAIEIPVIPTDISQLTDNQGLLADSFDGGGAASEYDEEQTIDGGGA